VTHSIFDDRIAGLAFMLDLPEEFVRRLVALFQEVGEYHQIPEGTVLFAEDDSGSEAGYVLVSGSVRVERGDEFRQKVAAPALLGEMRQFHIEGRECRSATVRATGDIEVFRFEWPSFYAGLTGIADEGELEMVRESIKRTAWMHYLEQEGDI
jgi:CRP-like cAMP-binding protein